MTGRKKALFPSLFLLLTFWILCTASLCVYATTTSQASPTASKTTPAASQTTPPASQGTTQPASQATQPASQGTPAASQATPAASPTASTGETTTASKVSSAVPAQTKPASKAAPDSSAPVSAAPGDSSLLVSSVPSSSSGIVLPDAGSVSEIDPLASALENRASSKKMNLYGMLAWACIILGAVVVVIVVLSNRRPGAGTGRSRYSRRPKRGRKHRLLGDKYYRNIHKY